jgi:hypothetical protein
LKLAHSCVGIWLSYQILLLVEIYFKFSM